MSLTDSTTKKDLPDTIEIIMDKLILIAGNVELVKSYLEGQDSFNESNPGLTPWNEGRLIWAVLDQIFKETSSAWNLLFESEMFILRKSRVRQ